LVNLAGLQLVLVTQVGDRVFSTMYRMRIASFSEPVHCFRSRLGSPLMMESSRAKGYANPSSRKFQFHLKQDSQSLSILPCPLRDEL